ncbi:radical SAM protein, partial [Myxococcota bacterium]|nr:radical SAM protein [Myxococcota bacterium]MBU1537892.1 radical SAM protein [Myxococcota bacterium]
WKSWSAQVRTDAVRDPELLALMERTHCSNVYIGFESVNPAALKEMKKQQTVQEMKDAVRKFKDHGIDIHGMFVFGFDSDTVETVDATIRFALESGIWSAQFLILTPLPGTPLFDSLTAEGRILDREWANFDTHHVVFQPKLLTPWDLQWAQIRAHSAFYSPARTLRHFVSFQFASGALYLYAMRLNINWKKKNVHYLKALEIEKESSPESRFSFSFAQNTQSIYENVRRAGASAL